MHREHHDTHCSRTIHIQHRGHLAASEAFSSFLLEQMPLGSPSFGLETPAAAVGDPRCAFFWVGVLAICPAYARRTLVSDEDFGHLVWDVTASDL